MTKATIVADAQVLIPNKDHKNFTESAEVIEAGTIVEGNRKDISGLRKGQPFIYKLFYTNKNQLIYLNKIKPMEKTEVTLGADAKVTPTVVDMKKPEKAYQNKVIGAIAGAVIGYAYCKYKKHDNTKTLKYAVAGAAVGVGLAWLYDRHKDKVTIKKSK